MIINKNHHKTLAKKLKAKHKKTIRTILKDRTEKLVLAAPSILASLIKKSGLSDKKEINVLIFDAKHVEVLDGGAWYELVPDIMNKHFNLNIDFIGTSVNDNLNSMSANGLPQRNKLNKAEFIEPHQLKEKYDIALSFSLHGTDLEQPGICEIMDSVKNSDNKFLVGYEPISILSSLNYVRHFGLSQIDQKFEYCKFAMPRDKNGLAWGEFMVELDVCDHDFPYFGKERDQSQVNLTNWNTQQVLEQGGRLTDPILAHRPDGHQILILDLTYNEESDAFYTLDQSKEYQLLASREETGLPKPPKSNEPLGGYLYGLELIGYIRSKTQQDKVAS